MKKRACCWALLLALLFTAVGTAEEDRRALTTEEAMAEAAEAAYPGWRVWRNTWYGSGMWEGELAWYAELSLLKIENGLLRTKRLEALKNPVWQGADIAWEETDFAPVPVTEEAAERMSALRPEEFMNPYISAGEVKREMLAGCAEFLLNPGEALTDLIAYPDYLVAAVRDERQRRGLRIAHWNGEIYDGMTVSPMQADIFDINVYHSWNDWLEIMLDDGNAILSSEPDGIWRLTWVTAYPSWGIREDWIIEYDDFASSQNNDFYHYGHSAFPTRLEELRFDQIPTDGIEGLVAGLDAGGFACVKTEGAEMRDSPDGQAVARCFARMTGKVTGQRDGWTRLRIGSKENGLEGWLRTEDLAFGLDIENVLCAFPSYDNADSWQDLADQGVALPPQLPLDDWPGAYDAWLVGELPGGGYLMEIGQDAVVAVPEGVLTGIGPTCHAWEDWDEEEPEDMETPPPLDDNEGRG